MKTFHFLIAGSLLLAALCGTSCTESDSEQQLKERATTFATLYFNWQFSKALSFCTPESQKWLRYAASQVCQNDIDTLRSKEVAATVHVANIQYAESDTLATVRLLVSDCWYMGNSDMQGTYLPQAEFTLPAVCRHVQWLIKMEGLPRNEKKSRD